MSDRGACLIAGCGDTGIRIARRLGERGQRVYGLRRNPAVLPPGIVPVAADLTDAARLHGLPDDLDTLVYLPTPHERSRAGYEQIYRYGLERVLAALPQGAANLRRIVFVSSTAVYGEHAGGWVDETTPCQPLAFNGEVLLHTEQWLLGNFANACALRFAGIYGPGRTWLIDALRGQRLRVQDGAPRYTNRIHVEDAAAAVVHLLDQAAPPQICNVVDDLPAAEAEVYDWLADRLGVARPARELSAQSDTLGNKRVGNARLRASGFALSYPDFRSGYGALIDAAHG